MRLRASGTAQSGPTSTCSATVRRCTSCETALPLPARVRHGCVKCPAGCSTHASPWSVSPAVPTTSPTWIRGGGTALGWPPVGCTDPAASARLAWQTGSRTTPQPRWKVITAAYGPGTVLPPPGSQDLRVDGATGVLLIVDYADRWPPTHLTWLLRNAAHASTVTIGSDLSCDWQIHARDVPGHALSVALIDGALCVAAASGAIVKLNGKPLPEAWQRVNGTRLLEVGAARIELVSEASPETSSDSERERPTLPDDIALAPRQAAAAGGWFRADRRSAAVRHARSSLIDTPTLLGRAAESRASSQLLRYATLLLFTALAYRAWLLLLDRL